LYQRRLWSFMKDC